MYFGITYIQCLLKHLIKLSVASPFQMTSNQHRLTQAVRESFKLGKEMKLP